MQELVDEMKNQSYGVSKEGNFRYGSSFPLCYWISKKKVLKRKKNICLTSICG